MNWTNRGTAIDPYPTAQNVAKSNGRMAEDGKSAAGAAEVEAAPPDAQLFGLLANFLQQVEALTNQEEVELRSKIEALGLEVTKVPPKSTQNLDELEIAQELDKLSAKLDDVDEMISAAMAADPQVKSLLSSTADVWMPVITATSDERQKFTPVITATSDERQKFTATTGGGSDEAKDQISDK